MNKSLNARSILIATLISMFIFGVQMAGETEKDPYRRTCVNTQCRKIKRFLKSHYCGESPFGNGPNDGCEIKRPKTPDAAVKVLAEFDCKWDEGRAKCEQHAQPSSETRTILIREMRKLGLPAKDDRQVYFTVWESIPSGWSLAEAYYSRSAAADLTLCQVIAMVDQNSHVRVLRKVPFQKTDADKPAVTTWAPVDLTDVDGDGQVDVVLEADAYEDHWLEVDSTKDGSPHTIFSGLGYYL